LEEEKLRSPVAVIFGETNDVMIRTQDELKVKGHHQIAAEVAKQIPGAEVTSVGNPPRDVEGYAESITVVNATEQQLTAANIFNAERFGKVLYAQNKDNSVTVAIANPLAAVYSNYLKAKIEAATQSTAKILSSESVGSQVGEELLNK